MFNSITTKEYTFDLIYNAESDQNLNKKDVKGKLDFETMEFTPPACEVDTSVKMSSVEHLDNCQLLYLLNFKDVAWVRDGEDSYISGKLTSTPDDDGTGDGYVDTQFQLFMVSEPHSRDKRKKNLQPKKRIKIEFLLN